jgi:hypothetical protein
MDTINTTNQKPLPKNSEQRRAIFVKANLKYLSKGDNREKQRQRCLNYYYYNKELKRLMSINCF